jgi:outer membrane biosynthesis protein TonB
MVDTGFVELPTIERVFTISRETSPRERTAVRQRVELAAAKTIMRSGCAATWEFTDPRTIKVTFTPLSEHDASDVDQYMPQFARDVAAIFSRPAITDSVETLRLTPSSTPPPEPPEEEPVKAPAKLAKEPKVTARGEEPAAPRTKEPVRKAVSPAKEPARKAASPAKEPARKAASPAKEPARKAAPPAKEPTAARATTKRATTTDKTAAKKAPAATREAAPRSTAKAAKTAKTTAKKR